MPDTQYFTNIDGKYVKDAEARQQLNDLEDYVEMLLVPVYVDNNSGITCRSGFENTDYAYTDYAELSSASTYTIEICTDFTTTAEQFGRILQIGDNYPRNFVCGYNMTNGHTYIEFALNDKWAEYPALDTTIDEYLGKTTTITFVIGNNASKLYINGVLKTDSIALTKSDIDVYNSYILFLHGTTADRECNGKLYALRIYNKELSTAEIQQNAEADVFWYGS